MLSELWSCYFIKQKYLTDNKTQVSRYTQIYALFLIYGLYDNNFGSNSAGMKNNHLKENRISVLSVLIHIHVPYLHIGMLVLVNMKISLNETKPWSQHYFPSTCD